MLILSVIPALPLIQQAALLLDEKYLGYLQKDLKPNSIIEFYPIVNSYKNLGVF